MPSLRHYFKGDTLIEVTIAIGIFALVAISVVAVVSISTSGAQSALETTLTREEVDAQAEALRFIQGAFYEDNKDILNNSDAMNSFENKKESLYRAVWKEITEMIERNSNTAIIGDEIKEDFAKFEPATCNELYDDDAALLKSQNAFILNLKKLNSYHDDDDVENFAKEVVININGNNGANVRLFQPAITYPQLEYDDDNELIDAQGIYIVGVKDIRNTTIVENDGTEEPSVVSGTAYYDFYVRSCWYNSGSENLSKVSTSVRLHDPTAIAYVPPKPTEGSSSSEGDDLKFSGWKKYGDIKYNQHYQPYCSLGIGPRLSRSGTTYTTDCEPIEGQHIITNGDTNDITIIGSTANATNLGVYFDEFNINMPFSIIADIDASNVASHPNYGDDGLRISLDLVDRPVEPENKGDQKIKVQGVSAVISQSNKYVSISDASERITTSVSQFKLLLEYSKFGSNAKFTACITEPGKNEQCISSIKPIGDGKYLRVDYNSTSGGHGCNEIGVIKLFGVNMSHSSHGNITF